MTAQCSFVSPTVHGPVTVISSRMPVTYEFDGSILRLALRGEYPQSEIRGALTTALQDASRPVKITGLLVDLTSSLSIGKRTLGEITSIIGFLVYHARSYGGRVALVAVSDAAYGLVRMADVDLDIGGLQTHAFREVNEALRWLQGEGGAGGG